MRILFVKTELSWPRTSGHDVHTYHMIQALSNSGHDVALLTLIAPEPVALKGLKLIDQRVMPVQTIKSGNDSGAHNENSKFEWRQRWNWRQERFRSYWGIDGNLIRFTRDHAEALEVDAVVVAGLEVLPYLSEIRCQQRIWYAADEWVWHHLSLFHFLKPRSWSNIRRSLILGLYENTFASAMDRVWVVSATDQRAMRCVTWTPVVDLIPNGVSTKAFTPTDVAIEPLSCTFWGNLAFAPNEQALSWFCQEVWPLIKRDQPDAQFNVFGCNPSPEVLQLSLIEGVHITPDVPDIPSAVSNQAVVVLPFQSGGGIKNKLLESASLAKPTVCSPRACNGLNTMDNAPFLVVPSKPRQWSDAIQRLWADPVLCRTMGLSSRQWVIDHHSWESAAMSAAISLDSGSHTSVKSP